MFEIYLKIIYFRLYDKTYGKETTNNWPRKKIPHIPLMIDKEIMLCLFNKFPLEFERTSSNRFRSSNDMQFAFSYYQFIIKERKWPYEVDETDDTWLFVGVGNEKTRDLKKQFRRIKRELRKFICFNDDIDYTKKNKARFLMRTLNQFYYQLFPEKSQFEI